MRPATRLRYVPSLDGLRGLAVAAVFLFHANVGWASSGFLGVSLFFTLSGFLITSLLLVEAADRHAIALVRFWARRMRRLLPAALLTILLVLLLSATVLRVDPATLRGDALAAIGYVANWHLLLTGQSYANLFRDPSPLVHYWSLAIEEQFYLLFPLAVLAVLRLSAGRDAFRRNLRVMLLCALGVSALTSVIAGALGATDFVYYSLPTRGGEILVGALLATFVFATPRGEHRPARWWSLAGVAALGAIAYLATTTTSTTAWVTHGGLLVFALLSALVILGGLASGPLATALAVPPLRWLGRISYGVYLYHWPIILWLTADRVGASGFWLVAVQAAVTLAAATASYFLVELPIRQGRVITERAARLSVPIALVLVGGLTVWTTASFTQPPLIDFASTAAALHTGRSGRDASHLAAPSAPGSAHVAPPTVEMIGDSTGLQTAIGLTIWADTTHRMTLLGWTADGNRWLGCGIVQAGLVRYEGVVSAANHSCGDRNADWGQVLDATRPAAVVLQFGPFDVADHLLPGDTTWRGPGDPTYDKVLLASMQSLADVSLDRGIPTIWLTSPAIDLSHTDVPAGTPLPEANPARTQKLNDLLRTLARERPAVHLADLAAWVTRWPGGEFDANLRPDGVHFSWGSAYTVADWLGPAILRDAQSTSTAHLDH
ncbi:MAG TPA: acyltransferase family protein [Acidimicrobiia bacterium]